MSDDWAGVEAALGRFGLPARPADRDEILAALDDQVRREADEEGDHFLMRLLCAQLFSLGRVEDALAVWRAKSCNFDTHCGIDVTLLCGAGLGPTKVFLSAAGPEGAAALAYLCDCEAAGDFAAFGVESAVADLRRFYRPDPS